MTCQLLRAGLGLCLALMACTTVPNSHPVPTTPATRPSAVPSLSGMPTRQETTAPQLRPQSFVGDWESVGGDATLVYRFTPDGRFAFAGVMTQARGEGFYQFTHTEKGTVVVRDSLLVLQPTSAKSTRKDPEDPEGDYVDQSEPLVVKKFRWRATSTELVLVDEAGIESTLRRQ